MTLAQGQKVRLNKRGRQIFSKGAAPGRLPFVNWGARIGIVGKIMSRKEARILWQGRKSLSEALPISLLETTD